MFRLTFALLILALVGACDSPPRPPEASSTPTQPPELEIEEYAVYRAVIEALFVTDQTERVVVVDQTTRDERPIDWSHLQQSLSELSEETVIDFVAKNQQSLVLAPDFNLNIETILISQAELEELFVVNLSTGWKRFYDIYPGSLGYLWLSRVGLNAEQTQALVRVSNLCHSRCGSGQLLLLTKVQNAWVIQAGLELWIS